MPNISSIENIQQSFNFSNFAPTFVLFTIGLLYYIYKNRNIRNHVIDNNVDSLNNNIGNSNAYNSSHTTNAQNLNENHNQNQNSNNYDNINTLKIYILLQSERKIFHVRPDCMIRDFIVSEVKQSLPDSSTQTIILICQGRRLDESKTFSDYPIITNDTVIHCFLTNSGRGNSSSSDASFNNNSLIEDENAVSIYTLIIHASILIFILLLIICYKTIEDLLTTGALLIFQFMLFIWVTQVSKCIAKLVVHRKISFN